MIIKQIQEEYMGKLETIIHINKPSGISGYMTTYDYCPSCNFGGLFRVYNSYREIENRHSYIGVYESQCPKCFKAFDIVDIMEKDCC